MTSASEVTVAFAGVACPARNASCRAWLAAAAATLVVLVNLIGGCTHAPPEGERARSPSQLSAPGATNPADLDLLLHWRSARIEQELLDVERRWKVQVWYEPIVRGGAAHRTLLVLPSVEGGTTRVVYRVAIPEDCACELVTWLTLAPDASGQSDGVEFAVTIEREGEDREGAGSTETTSAFGRLPGGESAEWREVRADLSSHRGATVLLALEVREPGDRAGDWVLWADPRIRQEPSPEPARIDLAGSDVDVVRAARIPWREVNVFKAYYAFNDAQMERGRPSWIGRYFPWLRSIRLFSSLGGNWGPTLERDYEAQMSRNPTMDLRGETQWARQFEFFRADPDARRVPIGERFDWSSFDVLMARAATSGLDLHVNLAGAPEAFTGRRGYYGSYHYNEMPVVDEQGWKAYVRNVFGHIASQPWFGSADFSFFSEANCRWIDGTGRVSRTGFQGDAAEHARQYLWTWQAMKPYFGRRTEVPEPGPRLHLGPWVVEPDAGNAEVDNLDEYLGALTAAFAAAGEPLPPWSAFAFNLYETPFLPLDGFVSYKMSAARETLARALPGVELPLRLDEYGIHPLVESVFHRETGERLEASRWATTWHAEMLALLLAENVESAGTWMASYLHRSLLAHLFMSYVNAAVVLHASDEGELHVAGDEGNGASEGGGEPDEDGTPPLVRLRLASRSADRLGAAWSRPRAGSVRLLLWRHPRFPATDERHMRGAPLAVDVELPGPADDWRVVVTRDASQASPFPGDGERGADDRDGARAERDLVLAGYPGAPPLRQAVLVAEDGRLRVELRDTDLLLIEVEALTSTSR